MLQFIGGKKSSRKNNMKQMYKLDNKELLFLMEQYSNYVIEFYDTHSSSEYPVCIQEFYKYEFQEILKEQNDTKL